MKYFKNLANIFSTNGLKKSFKVGVILGTAFLSGCSDLEYAKHKIGELKGRLIIEWISSDSFRFIKHKTDPLRFTRHDGTKIVPDTMVTDGGSVPAALRAVKTYSPWGFGPAFVIHDWLFQMKSCKLPGYESLTLESSADIMAEIIKTMMESDKYGEPDKLTLYSMHQAVKSRYAKDMWDNGVCVEVPGRAVYKKRATRAPTMRNVEPGRAKVDRSEQPPLESKEHYTGKQAQQYQRQMEVVTEGMAATPKFSFEQSY